MAIDVPSARSLLMQEYLATQELLELRQRKQETKVTAAKWLDDPLGFVDNCVIFPVRRARRGESPEPGGLAPYQREIIASVPVLKRVSVRGPHSLGKTTTASMVVLWFALTREMAGIDWKIMTTAGSWTQLSSFLWPEIRKWAYCINWEQVGRGAFSERTELQKHNIRLMRGLATSASPETPERMEGMHADEVLWLYDEAKLLGPGTFESAEGAFAAAGDDSSLKAYALAISTPGECAGPFYNMHHRTPEWEDWHPRHVTMEEAIAAGRMSRDWANKRKKLWGENSAVYQNRVLGEFCSSDEDAIVPLSWAEAAIERWREWDAAGRPDPGDPHVVGVDVGDTGPDKSVAVIRWGDIVTEIRSWGRQDTMRTTGRVAVILGGDPSATAVIDVIGVGAGVYARGKELGLKVDAFDVRKKTTRRDSTGHFGFVRLRDAAWFRLRELLDPSQPGGAKLALPPDDELLGDITALHFQHMSDGKVHVEEKAEMRKRLGRSPDKGDALIAAMWVGQGSFLDAYGVVRCPNGKCPRGTFYGKDERGKERTHCPYCREPLDVPDEEAA